MICNYDSTNKFETTVGMLNIAPTKISGQYKIVIDRQLKIWLDDYTGRRVALDLNISFLDQVANFLQVETFLPDTTYLRYGGFQKETIKSWHIPFYFNKREYPKYFVISRVPNDNYSKENIDNLYVYGSLLKVVDIEHLGLWRIFDEIHNNRDFNYPLYFNHEESFVKLFGFGIKEGYTKEYTLNLVDGYANQTYIDVINNRILNTFEDQKMFFPRFINIELEFDLDIQVEQDFNNFYGFLSYDTEYTEEYLPKKYNKTFVDNQEVIIEGEPHNGYFLRTREDKFIYNQVEQLSDNFTGPDYKSKLEEYLLDIADGTVNEMSERQPQVRFELSIISIGDVIRIKSDDNVYPDFEYQVQYDDIKGHSDLYQCMIQLCFKMTKLSKRDFEFSCKLNSSKVIVTVVCNLEDSENYYIKLFNNAKILDRYIDSDNYKYFRGITPNDVYLCGQPNLCDNHEYVYIENVLYYIKEKFKFDGYTILRLIDSITWDKIKDSNQEGIEIPPVNIKKQTIANIKETKIEKCIWLKPINFLKYYSTVDSKLQSNYVEYVCSLIYEFTEWNETLQKFVVKNSLDSENKETDVKATYFISAIEKYTGIKWNELIADGYDEFDEIPGKKFPIINKDKINPLSKELYQYVNYNTLIDVNKIEASTVNESLVKNMLFNSVGNTGYMTPNILNIDKQFWQQNGCLDVDKSRADLLRYTWFLLGGKRPSYVSVDDWRYMTITEELNPDGTTYRKYRPKITSRLNRITDSLCETIFLGVKYYLPVQYENYEFAVYLEYNNPKYLDEPVYLAEVYPKENLVLISINKYLDFSDLIRGGNKDELGIVDLSFFLNIKTSLNQSSDYYTHLEGIGDGDSKVLLLEPFYDDPNSNVYYNGIRQENWIIDTKLKRKPAADTLNLDSYDIRFCLRATNQNNLKHHFVEFIRTEENKDEVNPNTLYIVGEVEYEGKKYTYYSMKLEFIDVEQVESTYLWFKDLKVTFFDTKEIFLHRLKKGIDLYDKWNKPKEVEEILKITQDSSTIIEYQDVISDSIYSRAHKIATIVTGNFEDKFELLLPAIVEGNKLQSKPISLLDDWYRVTKLITENQDGEENLPIIGKEYGFDNKPQNFQNYIDSLITDLTNDEASYVSEITLFDRNQIWKIVQEMLYNNVRFKEMTEDEMWQELDKFSIEEFLKSKNRSIQIINNYLNNQEFVDKYIVVSAFNIDKNYVIWNVNNNPSIIKINRHQTTYYPFLPLETDIIKFQIINNQKNNTIWNLYDTKFGGSLMVNDNEIPISATTLWKEITGNIVSTLYCKTDKIRITIPYNKHQGNKINYLELLKSILNYNDCIVSSDNKHYIESLNKNVKPYIIETYANMLLSKFYRLDAVTNQEEMRLPYTIDNQQPYTIIIGKAVELSSCYLGTESLTINLIRK